MSDGGASAIRDTVSREIYDRLAILVEEIRRWQTLRNLVSRRSLDDIWTRHVADSLQLADLGGTGPWADIGSGGGFPGLVVAIARPDIPMTLIESDGRKAAFLRHAARMCEVPITVMDIRAEQAIPRLDQPPATVSARAVADLSDLLDLAAPALLRGAVGLFLKGQAYSAELTRAREAWTFAADILPSRTDPDARILRIRDLRGRRSAATS